MADKPIYMFWKLLGSMFIGLFVTGAQGFLPLSRGAEPLSLAQQKNILEWNQEKNDQKGQTIIGAWSSERLTRKLDKIKNQDQRLFMQETISLSRRDLKFRLSQENTYDLKPRL